MISLAAEAAENHQWVAVALVVATSVLAPLAAALAVLLRAKAKQLEAMADGIERAADPKTKQAVRDAAKAKGVEGQVSVEAQKATRRLGGA